MADEGEELNVAALKVAELRDELKKRGLQTTGLKAELAERLTEALQAADGGQGDAAEQAPGPNTAQDDDDAAENPAEAPVEPEAAAVADVETEPAQVDAAGLTVPELKKELEKLGLPTAGRKADLVQRLEEAQGVGTSVAEDTAEPAANAENATDPGVTGAEPEDAAKKVAGAAESAEEATNATQGEEAADAATAVEMEAEADVANERDVNSMTVAELKDELSKRGLATSGRKGELVDRLVQAIEGTGEKAAVQEPEAPAEAAEPAGAADQELLDASAAEEDAVQEEDADEEGARAQSVDEAVKSTTRDIVATAAADEAEPMDEALAESEQGQVAEPAADAQATEPSAEGKAPAAEERAEEAAAAEPAAAPAAAEAAGGEEAPELDFEEEQEPELAADETPAKKAEEPSSQPRRTGEGLPRKRSHSPVPAFKPKGASEQTPAAKLQKTGSGRGSELRVSGGSVTLPAGAGPREPAPPPNREPTAALLIEGFMRPFTLPQVKELLGQTGTVKSLWMPTIKNLAYVVYENAEEAEATRQALHDLQWPKDGRRLRPQFVEVEDAAAAAAGTPPSSAARPAAAAPTAAPVQQAPAAAPAPTADKALDARNLIAERRQQRQAAQVPIEPAPVAEEEPMIMDLDKLFRKTKTEPQLYWLPLTEKEAAERAQAKAKAVSSRDKPTVEAQ